MFYDLNKTDRNFFFDKSYDVCIIGGGVVGITLAEYLKEEARVVLLEAGDVNITTISQNCYKGNNTGFPYYNLENCRARYLGGSSNWWGGFCHELSVEDFEEKPGIPLSGWPISKEDLDPYREESFKILDIKTENNDEKNFDLLKPHLNINTNEFKAIKFHYSPPTNFKEKYEDTLKNKRNLDCFINANVTDLHLNTSLDSAKSIEVKNYNYDTFTVHAKIFIMATGGIENARLLLNFNTQQKAGIGNAEGLVGKCFSDHPHGLVGQFILEDRHKRAIKRLNIEKNTTLLFPIATTGHYEKKSVFPATTILLDLNPKLVAENGEGFKEKIRNIICSISWTKDLAEWYAEKEIACLEDGMIHIETDQRPNTNSSISLSNEKDYFGLRRVELKWAFTARDVIGIKQNIKLFAEVFAKNNIGRVKLEKWVLEEGSSFPSSIAGGKHHMGTTRMAKSKEFGVVDQNLKVFGIDNLFLGGSSVFPTYGKVNPTFTIVQMTLRLVDHIHHRLRNLQSL